MPPTHPTGQPTGLPSSGIPIQAPPTAHKVQRTRQQIEQERNQLLARTEQEIDVLLEEFHQQLPRGQAQGLGGCYARHSTQFQDSITDQLRTLFEAATREKIHIPREYVFYDVAVRGGKDRRPGLAALREAVRARSFQTFLAFTTSRLFRKNYKALQFVEEELVERGLRAIFVKSGLDTASNDHWRIMLQLLAAVDENVVQMYGAHIQAAHEGLFLRRMVHTSLPLGYAGEVVPDEFTKRNLPRRRIVVDPDTAPWIMTIFRWYVEEHFSLDQIARRLNDDPQAPAPANSLTGLWTHALVRQHLVHAAYRGYWTYGAKKTQWSSSKDYARQTLRPEPLKSVQFEELRIIEDPLWAAAQLRLATEPKRSGRPAGNGVRKQPGLLRGLFVCPEHDRQLSVCGAESRVLQCPLCRAISADRRPLFTHLNRELALQLTCQRLAELIRADSELVEQVIVACQREAERRQQPDPEKLNALRAQLRKLDSTLDFNRRHPGETAAEQQSTARLLKQLSQQRVRLQADLLAGESASRKQISIPEAGEIRELLHGLEKMLNSAAAAAGEEEQREARQLIDQLTGGKIELFQMGERKTRRGWLRGRFVVDVVSVASTELTGIPLANPTGAGLEIQIDYQKSRLIDQQAEEARQLWEQGLLNKQIAERMNCSPAYVTRLISHWFESRNLPQPDGRKRRHQLPCKQMAPPLYQQLADEVVRLVEQGLSNRSIANQVNTSDATVGQSIAWWYRSRGLPVPTGKARQRKKLQRAKSLYEEGRLIKDIASELGYSPRGLTLALKACFAELGEVMPDGRSRRGNASCGETANGLPHRDQEAPDTSPE